MRGKFLLGLFLNIKNISGNKHVKALVANKTYRVWYVGYGNVCCCQEIALLKAVWEVCDVLTLSFCEV